jgi:hypothetical protein
VKGFRVQGLGIAATLFTRSTTVDSLECSDLVHPIVHVNDIRVEAYGPGQRNIVSISAVIQHVAMLVS